MGGELGAWRELAPVLPCAAATSRAGHTELRAAAGVPAGTTGRDAGKKVPDRKRGLAVDVVGLVIAGGGAGLLGA
ncbi:hypothetical protein [Nonomuraea dietziae]|uniref:hypothetical protein n=1 Tax=Nonomuraea dietziae TaxID=65515 RepID=UPI0031DF478C